MTQATGQLDDPSVTRRGVFVAAVLTQAFLVVLAFHPFDSSAGRAWVTIFIAISFQALPFLVMGVVLAGAIAAFVSPAAINRVLPRRTATAIPVAGLAGIALPGCECASVPVAGRAMAAGVPPAVALTFLLSAPAINPVVMASTAVAFPGRPEMVLARFVASLAVSVLVGWVWLRVGRDEWVERARARIPDTGSTIERMRASVVHDFLHAGGYLILGAAVATTIQVAVPRSTLDDIGTSAFLAVPVLAVLAVVLAMCSEADAFVAASLTQFSRTAQLTFMVVGPAVDVKLIAMQAGVFGRPFATRFAPLTFVLAVVVAIVVGAVLL